MCDVMCPKDLARVERSIKSIMAKIEISMMLQDKSLISDILRVKRN